MKQKKNIIIVIAVLVILTAALTIAHLITRTKVPEGSLMITYQGKVSYVELDKLAISTVSGTIVNGKGEEKEGNEQGSSIADVLSAANINVGAVETVTVIAADEFSAKFAGEEIREEGKIYLANDRENGMRLIVFGDSDSKRNVRDVERLDVQ